MLHKSGPSGEAALEGEGGKGEEGLSSTSDNLQGYRNGTASGNVRHGSGRRDGTCSLRSRSNGHPILEVGLWTRRVDSVEANSLTGAQRWEGVGMSGGEVSGSGVALSVEGKIQNADAVSTSKIANSALLFVAKVIVILAAKTFATSAWPYFRVLSLANLKVRPLAVLVPSPVKVAAKPFAMFSTPMLVLSLAAPVVRRSFPDLWRTLRYWRRLLPIYAGYMRTKYEARNKSPERREELWAERHEWGGEKVYRLVLEMSGFYVKSAQVLASKGDFMPHAWTMRLSKLFDDAPPRPFAEVAQSIEHQLQVSAEGEALLASGPVKELFKAVFREVEETALASASIAQVHRAILKDGTPVVVKVQHLGMDIVMHSDLRNIGWVAKFLRKQLPFDLTPVVKEIQTTIPLEFDFLREVSFMNTIGSNLKRNGVVDIVCPRPWKELCAPQLIVMERLDGVPFTQIINPQSGPHIRAKVPMAVKAFARLVEAYGPMIFIDGVFHADPHPGNLLLLEDGRMGLLDFGQSKVLDEQTRKQLAQVVVALAGGDVDSIVEAVTDAGMIFKDVDGGMPDKDAVVKMAYIMFDTRFIAEALVSPMCDDHMVRKTPLASFNQALWLVVRALVIMRGLANMLQVDLSAVNLWQPYAKAVLEGKANPIPVNL
ncbi:hypothetical protein CBR_g52669 [Chara braunii]|uniref:Protein kinase domain-containing protein n=1 Tax=Chara braunii TaxID=69332 RepID=A0A388MAU8_CHABU|nr:hypothetical protein CBR_g52669 [Chara braunii]|eukprot:GBG91635.1 hypothetical protein CBR_g52669 [Chara braunii]